MTSSSGPFRLRTGAGLKHLSIPLSALLAVLTAGCADEGAQRVAHDPMQVRLAASDEALIPTTPLPGGLHLRVVNPETPTYSDSWVALYGDPELEDPLTGTTVHVVYVTGSETGAGWREGSVGDSTWLSRRLPDDDQEVDSVVVGGRGVDTDDLQRMLDRLVVTDPIDPDRELRAAHLADRDVPSGLALLAEGALPLENAFWPYSGVVGGGPGLLWTDQTLERQLRIATVSADPATHLLIRSIISSPRAVDRAGATVALGSPSTVPPEWASTSDLAVWEEAGMLVVAQTMGLEAREIEQLIRGLRVTQEEDWPALVEEAELAPPPDDRGVIVANGHVDGVRWWIADVEGPHPQYDVWLETVDGRAFGQGSIGGCPGSSATAAVLDLAPDPVSSGSVTAGVAPAGTGRVELQSDRGAIDASMATVDDGRTLWWVWSDAPPAVTSITAFRSDGTVLERLDVTELGGLSPGSSFCAPPAG